MIHRYLYLVCAAILTISSIGASGTGDGDTYTSFFINDTARLHIRLVSGQYVLAPKEKYQAGFDSPAISPDGKTIGWLQLYPFPKTDKDDYDSGPIASGLAIYRNRRIIHQFGTPQVFYDWQFRSGGSEVAYATGPTHGGASEALLCDIASGKILARWIPGTANPPEWAKGLNY